MKKIFSALDLLWTIGLCLGMMQFISAQTVYESIDLTLAPGETMPESLQLTLPDLMTMTETSMITMIQVSTQMVTQMETITETVSGTCAATPTLLIQPSITQQSQVTPSLVPLIGKSASTSSITVDVIPNSKSKGMASPPSTVPSATNTQSSTSVPKPCDCKCLCPASAFQISGPKTVSPILSMSTIKTRAPIVTPGQSVPPLASIESASLETASPETASPATVLPETSFPSEILAQSTGMSQGNSFDSSIQSTTKSTSPIIAAALTTSRNVTWTSASPTPHSNPPSIVPFNINTFSLHSSVSVPLNIRGYVAKIRRKN